MENLLDIIVKKFPEGVCDELINSQRLTEYGVVLSADLIPSKVKEDSVYTRIKNKLNYWLYKHPRFSERKEEFLEKIRNEFDSTLKFDLFIHLKVSMDEELVHTTTQQVNEQNATGS